MRVWTIKGEPVKIDGDEKQRKRLIVTQMHFPNLLTLALHEECGATAMYKLNELILERVHPVVLFRSQEVSH